MSAITSRETPQPGTSTTTPARRVGKPDDLAAAAMFAMTNPFVTGTVISVDGGGVLA